MTQYYPYKSDRPDKKYYIITSTERKVYFGQAGASDYTIHKDDDRKKLYEQRHKKREDWTKSGIDTAGFWSYHYLWKYPTKTEAYKHIKNKFL